MRIMGVALLLAMGAVVILALGEAFNIWASTGLINISLILLLVIPLSMMCFVFRKRAELSVCSSARTHPISKQGLPQANGIAICQHMALHALAVDKSAIARADIFEDVL